MAALRPLLLSAVLCAAALTACGKQELGPQRPAGVALCYTPLAEEHPATVAFREALLQDNRTARASAIAGLDAAANASPQEEAFALMLGLAHLWRLADPLPEEAKDPSTFIVSGLGAKNSLERARALCPTDYRIPAWLGPVLVNAGRALNNQDTVAEGFKVLQEGIDHYPSFVLFSKLLVYADRPASDPDFQQALQAVVANADACGDINVTRDPACRNSGAAPHNEEGSVLFLGDVYTKAGRKADALRVFEEARGRPGYASWGFQRQLADRIAALDARAAALGDADLANDPEVIWRAGAQCAVCHKR